MNERTDEGELLGPIPPSSGDQKLDTQHNFETKSTHLSLENRPASQFEFKTLLIPENSKLLLNLINKSTIFSFVKNN